LRIEGPELISPIIAAVEDLFFASKIRATAAHLGIEVSFVKSVEAALEAARQKRPVLIIADLHASKCDPFALARRLKEDEQLREIELVGFFSHVQTALQREAQAAGYDRVLPRSAFTRQLSEILRTSFPSSL
jgi:CheY-like chemotaxis protein